MAKGRVLLAHGNTDCLKIYGSVLTFDGYVVEVTSDGDTAMRLLASIPFDAVVTDLYVQSAEDECLLRLIRAREFSAHLPVVIITGWTTDQHQRVAIHERADAFLPLPLRPRDLLDVVNGLLVVPHAPLSVLGALAERHDQSIANGL